MTLTAERVPVVGEDWLIDELAKIIERCGAQQFLNSPILEPTLEHFAERWSPDAEGVTQLCRKLLRHVGLSQLDTSVLMYSDPDKAALARLKVGEHSGAAAFFEGIENTICRFGCEVENLRSPQLLVGTLGHEVAHAFRHYHGLVDADYKREELLTDITTGYLGFGIFLCNSSHTYEKSGEVEGGSSITYEHETRHGYLPTVAVGFLFAAQVAARGLGFWESRRIAKHLSPNQRAYFREALRDLKRNRPDLLDMLGLAEATASSR